MLKLVCIALVLCHVGLSHQKPSRCNLPVKPGPCKAKMSRYYYNSKTGQCEQFFYGGCWGNANRFKTKKRCEKKCGRSRKLRKLRCSLPVKPGPCKARLPRYYYNSESGQCEQFFYGGCEGNANRFMSRKRCEKKCSSCVSSICFLPLKPGPCKGRRRFHYYNSQSGRCEKFFYGGCQGNANRFKFKKRCEKRCSSCGKSVCKLPSDSGPCKAAFKRYFFNYKSGKCEQFVYGGCSGNENNFKTIEECKNRCAGTTSVCSLPAQPGLCKAYIPSYFFNSKTGQCEKFVYGGCGGNSNRFTTLEECNKQCNPDANTNVCSLPAQPGLCKAYIPSYFFNSKTGQCEKFIYGGCGGNGNRFATLEECNKKCNPDANTNVCSLPAEPGLCKAYIPSYFFNSKTGQCEKFIYGGCGGNSNRFATLEECNKQCNPDANTDICSLPAVTGPCEAIIPSYYFNYTNGKCDKFIYGGCEGNGNRFGTLEECNKQCCPSAKQACCQPVEPGPCRASIPRFFFNTKTGACESFVYGGCKGNDNNFETIDECKTECTTP